MMSFHFSYESGFKKLNVISSLSVMVLHILYWPFFLFSSWVKLLYMLCVPPLFFPFNGCNSYILDILGTICLSILVIEFDVYKIISTTSLAVNAFVINLLSGLMGHCLACSVQVRRRESGFRFDPPDPKNKQIKKKNLNTFPLELLFFSLRWTKQFPWSKLPFYFWRV